MSRQKPQPSLKALVIGLNYKNTAYELKGCINDSLLFKDVLMKSFNYQEGNIRHITDETQSITPQVFLDSFTWLLQGAKRGDKLVFYFSGHGDQKPNAQESDGMDECIVCSDANQTLLVDDIIWSSLITRVPQGVTLNIFFDCCHSGSLADLQYNYIYTPFTGNMYTMSIENKNEVKGNVMCFAASYDSQRSADGSFGSQMARGDNGKMQLIPGKPHGAFTFFLTQTLRECSFNILCPDLLKAVYVKLDQNGYKQTPQFSCSQPQTFYASFTL